MHMYLQSGESNCVKGMHLVMCEVAIVLQINPSNHIGFFFIAGPNLSLTIDHMSFLGSPDFCSVQ